MESFTTAPASRDIAFILLGWVITMVEPLYLSIIDTIPTSLRTATSLRFKGWRLLLKANQIAQRRGDTNNVGRFDAEIKVFMPELVKVNSQKQHGNGSLLLNTFDEITSSVTDSSIASLLCMVAATHEM